MTGRGGPRRVAFLFNHDAAHQIAHSAGVLREYALANPGHDVVAVVANDAIATIVRTHAGEAASARIRWYELSLPRWKHRLLAPLNAVAPAYRLARLRQHLAMFARCDLIVSTERTCLIIKRWLGSASPPFVFIPHGAGDRNVSYHPSLRGFDLMLVSGQKVADAMIAAGIQTADRIRIVGYPKFDLIDLHQTAKIFGDDRPVFLYNPHFDPVLSSWYDHGLPLIEAFRRNPDLGNLIVAPHVMLFRKKLHISPEFLRARVRPDVAGSAGDQPVMIAPNILVDVGSPALMNMRYTLAADAYIGDASSQIYEFLVRPRACFFLDTRGMSTQQHSAPPDDVLFWKAGRVFSDVTSLVDALPLWARDAALFGAEQSALFHYTMAEPALGAGDESGSLRIDAAVRAATALADYLEAPGETALNRSEKPSSR